VFADPQVQHLGMATPMEHPKLGTKAVVASALNISGFPKTVRSPTPEAGADTDVVLREVGYTDGEIQAMREQGVV
jgi:formyl-CoA transferase